MPEVVSIPFIKNAMVLPTKKGPTIILNRFSDFKNDPVIKKFFSPGEMELSDNIIPMHETAHTTQFTGHKSSDGLNMAVFKMMVSSLLLRPVISSLAGSKDPVIQEELQTAKANVALRERNSDAFALSAVRKLRSQGVDLFRGIPNFRIFFTLDHALSSYDQALSKIAGSPISQASRKKARSSSEHSIFRKRQEYKAQHSQHPKELKPQPAFSLA